MTEPRNGGPGSSLPQKAENGSLSSRLLRPKQRRFLLPAAGAWILALDWLLFSSNALTAGLATPVAMGIGFVFGGAGVYLIQRKAAGEARVKTALKALLAGVVVGMPWPLGGTLVGGWVLLSSGLRTGR